MEPENTPLEKEKHLQNHQFFWGLYPHHCINLSGIIVQVKAANLPVKKPRIGHLEDRTLDFLISPDPSEFTPSSIGIIRSHFRDPYQSTRCNGINS